MLQVQILDGLLNITGICGNPESRYFRQEAALDQCRNRAVRASLDTSR